MSKSNLPHVAVIGFGEVGRIFAEDFLKAGVERVTVFDTAFADKNSDASKALTHYKVVPTTSAIEAVKDADLVFTSVTAANTLAAAQSVAPGIKKGAYYLDINSASPGVKREASEIINKAGGRYVESAVMVAVPPHRIASPMFLGGTHAKDFMALAEPLGFKLTFFSEEIGRASSVKMCRSVMIKGMESLITECMLTARTLGVEKEVLACLGETLPVPDWEKFARYMLTRTLQHGKRRAEEMREVAKTVEEAGVEPRMASAIAVRQDDSYLLGRGLDLSQGLADLVDAMRAAQDTQKKAAE